MVISDSELANLGRFVQTHDPCDIGKFRTPALRNVTKTAPYMHDGSIATLEEAIDAEVYYRALESGAPLILTPQERADLVAFVRDGLASKPSRTEQPDARTVAVSTRAVGCPANPIAQRRPGACQRC
jgi:cytochrome c peroxidase